MLSIFTVREDWVVFSARSHLCEPISAERSEPPSDTPLRLGNGITVRGSTCLEVRAQYTAREGASERAGEHTQRLERAHADRQTTHSSGKINKEIHVFCFF